MIWTSEYINLYISVRKSLTFMNVEKLSQHNIDHIGKMYNEEDYEYYKKKIFFKWFSVYSTNDFSFLKRSKKLIKKLNITLSPKEKNKIKNIEITEFTKYRTLKTIEVPYVSFERNSGLQRNAFFVYRNIRTYYKNINFLEKLYSGDIYITSKEIVLYNKKNDVVQMTINHDEIVAITYKSYCIKINLEDREDIYLRYKDNELIYISLNRSINTNENIDFEYMNRDDALTSERTIELILNINKIRGEDDNGK